MGKMDTLTTRTTRARLHKMKKKPATRVTKKYLLAVRGYDERFKEDRNEIFEFRSIKTRAALIRLCEKHKIDYLTTESK